jgi:hypothetical protein
MNLSKKRWLVVKVILAQENDLLIQEIGRITVDEKTDISRML